MTAIMLQHGANACPHLDPATPRTSHHVRMLEAELEAANRQHSPSGVGHGAPLGPPGLPVDEPSRYNIRFMSVRLL